MNYAVNNQACCEKMLGQLVWLSSTLIATDSCDKSRKSALGLTRADKSELAQIAKKGLQSTDSVHRSDGCWFFAYTLDTEDDQLIVEVCQGMAVSLLI